MLKWCGCSDSLEGCTREISSPRMEAVNLPGAWPLTTTTSRAAGDLRSGKTNRDLKIRSSLKNPASCSGGGSFAWRGEYDVRGLGFLRGRLDVQDPLFQQHHFQHCDSRCRSNEKSHSSPMTVVSDDDVEIHRKELLARYWDAGFEDETCEKDGKEEDDKNFEGVQNDDFIRRRAASKSSLYVLVGRKENNYRPEKRYWWTDLDTKIRRMLTPRTNGIVLLNILTFLYGSNISIIKNAGMTMDPTLFSVGRFAIASLVFTPFLSHAVTNKTRRNASIELGLLASAGYLTQCVSVLTSDASRVSFISTFTVIVVPLLAGLSGAKINKITWIAAATALLGVGILESNGSPFAIGDVWSFVSAVMFGVHMLRTEHHSTTLAHEDSLPVMALQLVVITMCSSIWFFASHFNSGDLAVNLFASEWPSLWAKTVALPWLPMLYTGLLSTAFCLWTELVSMRDVKATEAAVIYTTEPLWGAAFAWMTLGERWGPNGWLGALFILGGSLTMQLFGHPDPPVPKKIDLPPSSLDIVDKADIIDSFVEKRLPFIRTEEREVRTKVVHAQKSRTRKSVKASRIDNENF